MSHDDELAAVRQLDDALMTAKRSGRPEDWTYYESLRDAADSLFGFERSDDLELQATA